MPDFPFSDAVLGNMDPVEEAAQGSGSFAVMPEDPHVVIAGVNIGDSADQASDARVKMQDLEVRVEGGGGDEKATQSMGGEARGSEHGQGISDPHADSAEPRADSAGPRADSAVPRADSAEPRADSAEPRADSAGSRADSAEPRADSAGSRADSAEPRADSAEPRADSA